MFQVSDRQAVLFTRSKKLRTCIDKTWETPVKAKTSPQGYGNRRPEVTKTGKALMGVRFIKKKKGTKRKEEKMFALLCAKFFSMIKAREYAMKRFDH